MRPFGFKPTGGQILRDWHFKNVSVEGFGVGQLGVPGSNYFLGETRDFHFERFTVGGQIVQAPADGEFDFGSGDAEGFNRSESSLLECDGVN